MAETFDFWNCDFRKCQMLLSLKGKQSSKHMNLIEKCVAPHIWGLSILFIWKHRSRVGCFNTLTCKSLSRNFSRKGGGGLTFNLLGLSTELVTKVLTQGITYPWRPNCKEVILEPLPPPALHLYTPLSTFFYVI